MTHSALGWLSDGKALMALLAAHETQGVLLVAALIFCETGLVILPFLPGDSILFAVGAFAGLNDRSPWLPIAALAAAAIAGDGVNYLLGRSRAGRWIVRKGWISEANMERTRDYFERFGSATVTLGRFVPIVRTIAPFAAGLGAMAPKRFFLFNVVGALAWTSAMILAGVWLGRIAWVSAHLSMLSLAIVAVSVVPVVIQWRRGRRPPT